MKILVTGAAGFMGRNLVSRLCLLPEIEVVSFDLDTPYETLDAACADCGFVYHLAGVNRPKDQAEFMAGNRDFTGTLLDALKRHGNRCPVMLSSSAQAAQDNPYGESKRAGEALLFDYAAETGADVYVYRFPGVFGKWSRPNYNTVVATFCYNVARDLPIAVNDPSAKLTLVYIDDLVDALAGLLSGECVRDGRFCVVPVAHTARLSDIADAIRSFRDIRRTNELPDLGEPFIKKLYATYLSFLPTDGFSYPLTEHADARGSFTEILRSPDRGQVSVNVSKPGIVKGNHWHHTKNEKFLVVSGEAVIRFRRVGETDVIEYRVSGQKPEVVDIPTGYTHNIENVGAGDLVTLMWASECFDPAHPDTIPLEV